MRKIKITDLIHISGLNLKYANTNQIEPVNVTFSYDWTCDTKDKE